MYLLFSSINDINYIINLLVILLFLYFYANTTNIVMRDACAIDEIKYIDICYTEGVLQFQISIITLKNYFKLKSLWSSKLTQNVQRNAITTTMHVDLHIELIYSLHVLQNTLFHVWNFSFLSPTLLTEVSFDDQSPGSVPGNGFFEVLSRTKIRVKQQNRSQYETKTKFAELCRFTVQTTNGSSSWNLGTRDGQSLWTAGRSWSVKSNNSPVN